MSNLSAAHFSPQVQAILPVLLELNMQERLSLINLLSNNDAMSPRQKKLAPLDVQLFDKVEISDDFDEYLGDDFWFPEDDILYKHQDK